MPNTISNSKLTIRSVTIIILRTVFRYTRNLNKILQTQNIDLTKECKYVDDVRMTLENIRNDIEFLKCIMPDSKAFLCIESLTTSRVTKCKRTKQYSC